MAKTNNKPVAAVVLVLVLKGDMQQFFTELTKK